MVKATNAGGEAQSIADFRVLEPTPERMVEVVKTVVFEEKPIYIPLVSIFSLKTKILLVSAI